jgi:hypothetical protein
MNAMLQAVLMGLLLLPAPPAPAANTEEVAILAVVDRFMLAITKDDLALMAELQVADGMTFVDRPVEGRRTIVGRPNSYWVDPAHASNDQVRERYWNPTVLVRGQIAVVWTPYEFWRNGKTSHCGIDTFDMVKIDGRWRVGNAMWTVEPDACPELRPADLTAIRPRD